MSKFWYKKAPFDGAFGMAVITQSNDGGLWRDDEPKLGGLFWLPCVHGNHECVYALKRLVEMYVS